MKKILFTGCISMLSMFIGHGQRPLASFRTVSAIQSLDDKTVLFTAQDQIHGEELWITDNTQEGTRLLKDINKGYYNSSPKYFTSFKGQLYFSAYTQQFGVELWKTDGTENGTGMVVDLATSTSSSIPMSLTTFKDFLYFTTDQGGLYKTDGTADGTVLVDKLSYGRISMLTLCGNYLYYYKGGALRRTDGVQISSVPLPQVEPSANMYFNSIYVAGTKLIALSGSSYFTHIRLHALNAQENGWTLIKENKAPIYGDQEIENFTTVDNKLFFSFRTDYDNAPNTDELWVTDGTESGTVKLKSYSWDPHSYRSEMENFKAYAGSLYFKGGDVTKNSLWKSDGTANGTVQLSNAEVITPSYELNLPVISGGKLYFCGDSDLWVTDGTSAGTKKFLEVNESAWSFPYMLTDAVDKVYFITGNQYDGTVLWSTSPAPEINVLSDQYSTPSPIVSGGLITFSNILVDDCNKKTITIQNSGFQELMLSEVQLTGNDFFLKGELPEILEPGGKTTFDIFFNPLSPGKKEAVLIIKSNDDNEAEYTLKVSGQTLNSEAHGFCQSFNNNLVKSLQSIPAAKPLSLSNTLVEESLPPGTVVGTLSAPGLNAASYSLIEGKGAEDNALFIVEGNLLKTKITFSASLKKLCTVRLRASSQGAPAVEAFFRINITTRPVSYTAGDCKKVFERMDYGLLDIELNSLGHLFTMATDGSILKSIDDGMSWQKLRSHSFRAWQSKIFFKKNTGYIVTDLGIQKSDDNGATWFQLYFPFTPVSAFFFDDVSGFVSTSNGSLSYTADGGKTWERRVESSWDILSQLHFWNLSKGIAIRGNSSLVKTADGGKTWTTVDISSLGWIGRISALRFINDNEGFLSTDYYLFRSKDGGNTWTKVPNISMSGNYNPVIEFSDSKIGYLYGPGFFKTSDGGESWQFLSSPGLGRLTGIALDANGELFSSHITSYYSNMVGRAVNFSPDGGTTWQTLQTLQQEHYYDVEFPDEKTGFLFGQNSNYKTLDKGMTWQRLTWNKRITSAYFPNENTGLLSDGYKIYKTTDGAQTVKEMFTTNQDPNNYLPVGDLYGIDENVILAYSWYAMYRSADGGENWQLVNKDVGFYTQDVHFISSTIGYRIELFGNIQKTIDGGINWQNLFTRTESSSTPFNAIYFVDELIGYRAGDSFSKTTDGGVTWKDIFTNLYKINDLYFTDALHGYAVGRNGTLHETFDGGINWQQILIYDAEVIYGTEFRHGNIYLCGEDGFIGQLANTPLKPVQPGYVFGPNNVCTGDTQLYTLPQPPLSATYLWNVSSGAVVDDKGSTARIRFPNTGDYSFTITLQNTCGMSEERTFSVKAAELSQPVITGNDMVASLEKNVKYEVTSPLPDVYYNWDATGGIVASEGASFSLINWNKEATDSKVSVIATNPLSGCRSRKDLQVTIASPVGTIDETSGYVSVFPNPADHVLQIQSNVSYRLDIRLFDLVGREFVKTELQPMGGSTLDLNHIPPGLYVLELQNDNNRKKVTKKIIKK